MPDNWGFVAAAYAVTAGILAGYWRMLARKDRALTGLRPGPRARVGAGASAAGVRDDHESRSPQPSQTGHPRPEPASRPPLEGNTPS
jgi:hypothetical protein